MLFIALLERKVIVLLVVSAVVAGCTSEDSSTSKLGESSRWYSSEQVEIGQQVYVSNCIACHLENAQGTEDWKKTLEDGSYPPPPLNGTAHAWHHSIDVLSEIIQDGGGAYGGRMPPFKDVLSHDERLAVIAYFQSFWPEEIYLRWKDLTQ